MNHEGSVKYKHKNLYLQTMQSQKGGGGTVMISLMVRDKSEQQMVIFQIKESFPEESDF